MTMTAEEATELLAERATEYVVSLKWPDEDKSRHVWITRHSNHGSWIEDGAWVAMIRVGPLNPFYLYYDEEHGWVWRYKLATKFNTAEDAYLTARRAPSRTKTWETHP